MLRGGKEQNYGYLCTACVQGDFKSCSSCGALYHCREGGDVITKSGMNFGFYCGTCRHAQFRKSQYQTPPAAPTTEPTSRPALITRKHRFETPLNTEIFVCLGAFQIKNFFRALELF